MAHPTPRRGGWPGPRKETAWTFKPDPDAQAAVKRYMEEHRLTGEWGHLTRAINAMLTTHPDAQRRREMLQAQCQEARRALTAAGIGEGETLADGISELASRLAATHPDAKPTVTEEPQP